MPKNTKLFIQRIEEKIADLESKSAVEIVPVLVERSAHYYEMRIVWGLTFLFLSRELFSLLGHWDVWTQALGCILVFSLSQLLFLWPAFLRFFVPKRLRNFEVQETAHLCFLKEEIFATKNRTGLLIFISELEKGVFVLADKGLTAQFPSQYWAELGLKLAKDFSSNKAGDVFLEAIAEISPKLIQDFPVKDQDSNELSNNLRRG